MRKDQEPPENLKRVRYGQTPRTIEVVITVTDRKGRPITTTALATYNPGALEDLTFAESPPVSFQD